MREMDSNLRGFKSESGILIWNSRSSSPTMSGSAKESRKPESNNDSSASGRSFFLVTPFRIAAIRSLLSIRSLHAHGEKLVVLSHQFVEQHAADQAISGAGEVHVVALAEPGLHPLANRSRAAHARAPIPKCA